MSKIITFPTPRREDSFNLTRTIREVKKEDPFVWPVNAAVLESPGDIGQIIKAIGKEELTILKIFGKDQEQVYRTTQAARAYLGWHGYFNIYTMR